MSSDIGPEGDRVLQGAASAGAHVAAIGADAINVASLTNVGRPIRHGGVSTGANATPHAVAVTSNSGAGSDTNAGSNSRAADTYAGSNNGAGSESGAGSHADAASRDGLALTDAASWDAATGADNDSANHHNTQDSAKNDGANRPLRDVDIDSDDCSGIENDVVSNDRRGNRADEAMNAAVAANERSRQAVVDAELAGERSRQMSADGRAARLRMEELRQQVRRRVD